MPMPFVLTENNSIANEFLRELRDKTIQVDRMRFRRNMERLGATLAYEISKTLAYEDRRIATPLALKQMAVLAEQPVLITVLRAGLPFFDGFLHVFDKADCGFVGAYRQEGNEKLSIKLDYISTTHLENRVAIVIDPMLATGRSLRDSIEAMLRNGKPKYLHIASVVAAPEGIQFLEENIEVPYSLWTCAVDEHLDSNYYIVPGLGDAGDLSFGAKI